MNRNNSKIEDVVIPIARITNKYFIIFPTLEFEKIVLINI
jgi:hypothetical protein